MLRITAMLSAPMPRASPTPSTAPTRVCVVEMGNPVPEATTTVLAAARVAAKPRDGVRSVMRVPTVAITRWPKVTSPSTMPKAPNNNTHEGTIELAAMLPEIDEAPAPETKTVRLVRGANALAVQAQPNEDEAVETGGFDHEAFSRGLTLIDGSRE